MPEAFSLATWECALHGVVPVVYGLGALAALGRVGCPCVAPGDAAALEAAAVELRRRRTRRRRGGGTSSPARARPRGTGPGPPASGRPRPCGRRPLFFLSILSAGGA